MAKGGVWRNLKYKTLCLCLTGYVLTSIFVMVFWLQVQDQNQIMHRKTRIRDTSTRNGDKLTDADKRTITGTGCTFAGTFEDNFRKLENLPFPKSKVLMEKLGFNRVPTAVLNTTLPVLMTGANSKYYGVIQGLVKTVHQVLLPKYPDLKFIIYDLGLTDKEYEQTVKHCRCEVRKMPFDKLPVHVRNLDTYAFKAIIVNYVFQEFGHVWWVDSSVRFISSELKRALKYLAENGALFFTYSPLLNVALHTHLDTFRHFNEDPCPLMYFGEIEAGNVAFINNDVGRLILNRWAACSLDASCIAPTGSTKACGKLPTALMTKAKIGTCHRFDQSALSIILRRLYHERNDYPLVEEPIRIVKVIRGQPVHYFPMEN